MLLLKSVVAGAFNEPSSGGKVKSQKFKYNVFSFLYFRPVMNRKQRKVTLTGWSVLDLRQQMSENKGVVKSPFELNLDA